MILGDRLSRWTLAGVLWLGLTAVAPAADVRDAAKFFGDLAVTQATSRLATVELSRQVSVTLETRQELTTQQRADLKGLSGGDKDQYYARLVRSAVTGPHENSIVAIVWKDPSHLHVELGAGLQRRGFTVDDRRALRDALLEGFRAKQYDQALNNFVDVVDRLGREHPPGQGVTAAIPPAAGGAVENPHGRNHPGARNDVRHGGAQPVGHDGGGISWLGIILAIVAIFVVIRIISGLMGMLFGGSPAGAGMGPSMGGGGMFGSLLTGMFGAMAGHYLYDSFFSGHSGSWFDNSASGDDSSGGGFDSSSGDSGGGWADFGGGGDSSFGGGDFGGGDSGGGDF